ncbi:MAG: hypothetical protein N0C84_21320 [Candidatus Thiodiazotropha taylori]|uniref:Uncharacterized protein n=1 Tax=Candidatus Thiodiazotropha taylori TaxID=2792791 RepID=A0A9E4N7B5_9GAMM|nr:hypothetical protein [Candidatus Thiodiazotropha taylori]MCW4259010.1 hypothetical protein [Candidatus Thiodiazotropha taylori]
MENNDHMDVKKLTPEEVVKANPKIYWGEETPTYDVIDNSIISQLNESGCKNLSVDEFLGWHIISTDTDWVTSSGKSVSELFGTAHWLPGGGGNGFRFEYFLNIIASHLCVFKQDYLHQIKGDIEESFPLEIDSQFRGKTIVAYKLD